MPYYQISLAILCYLIALAPDLLHDVHMLQLNSYRTERYWRWLRQQWTRFAHPRQGWALAASVFLWFDAVTLFVLAWCGLNLYLYASRPKAMQKKKLVITSRVMRLLSVHGLFLAGLAALLSRFAPVPADAAPVFSVFLLGLFSPLALIVSNTLARPMEYLVGRYYYLDAVRILKAYGDLRVIGVTGSYGKTSTKVIVQQLLSTRFDALTTPQSYNTTLGVVIVIRTLLRPIHKLFVVEMGARQPGDIREICQLVRPSYGIITAIGEQHLETFGHVDNIVRTKLELFAALPEGGVAIYNADDARLRQAEKRPDLHYIGIGIDADDAAYRAVEMVSRAAGSEFTVTSPRGETVRFRTRLLGRHNVYNILAGIAVSCELGIPLAALAPAVASLQSAPHRLEVKRTAGGVTILDDAFSSNPLGAKYALEVLAGLEGSRKILITPGMVELGAREFALNQAFGEQAASVCDYVVLVGPKRAEPIRAGLLQAGYAEENIYVAADLRDGQAHLSILLREGDVVLYENDLPDTYNEAKAK